ncbi:winged helix-turn-helix domain-containing protein [Rhizobium sp. BK251]|uniref:ATP-binding protein n=1 Tax=Rhizobium sp. BK251 TaxID=2512125 RepID=UPI0010EAB18C|nr:winged helix-turn-helix domain-containing protein [Rhizobium sp. BK251]TCL70157.1 putative ATPase [Rhizobium sp. BK251]
MMDQGAVHQHEARFGPFRLVPAERLLEKDGVSLKLGSRALDILILLVERAGEVTSKDDLFSRVWPKMAVDEGVLRVHIAALRKALGEGETGDQYVTNVTGRGYCFVAPVARLSRPVGPQAEVRTTADANDGLPPLLARIVGRDEAVRALSMEFGDHRFVTLHGPGGIGKTTVAVAVGHALRPEFEDGLRFFDLGALSSPHLLPSAIASTLGLMVQSSDPTPAIVNFLSERRMLLILDNCEHVIEAAAIISETIFQRAPNVSILATSREPLRVEGERVYQLPPLATPRKGAGQTMAEVLAFPAAHLFFERAAASGYRFEPTDADAPVVADICEKLDGIALAIELAAGRAGLHGLRETAQLLDNRLGLVWQGRRTALPRHQTLSATLDWSYNLVTETEQTILRRLAIFVGTFSLQAAQAVVADSGIGAAAVIEGLGQLVAKSLVSARSEGMVMWYRLLDATRTYAHTKLIDCEEVEPIARRHALYYKELLEHANADEPSGPKDQDRSVDAKHLGNVRVALDWCFSSQQDLPLGIELAAAAMRLFIGLSLLSECRDRAEQALAVLDDETRGTRIEMELQAALGHALMFTRGNSDQAHDALARSLEIAGQLGDRFNQFRILGRLHMYYLRTGYFGKQLAAAEQAATVAEQLGDPVGMLAAQALLGAAHHAIGHQVEACRHLEASLQRPAAYLSISPKHFAFHRTPRIALSRTLWLKGCPDQAVQMAEQLSAETVEIRDHVTFCIALVWGVSTYCWIGDWETVEEYTERLIAHASRHSLGSYLAVGSGLKGETFVRRGEVDRGVDLLRGSLMGLRSDRYDLYMPQFTCALADGLAQIGRFDEALATMDDILAAVASRGEAFNMPELLRVRGDLLMRVGDEKQAEECFARSMVLAEAQSALSWQLRTATSFARLRLRQARGEEAHQLLAATYGRFREGFRTADLVSARLLLNELGKVVDHD